MNEYFLVAIEQHLERGKRLLKEIDTSALEPEFHLLAQTCRNEILQTMDDLRKLRDDDKMQLPPFQSVRLRRFRRAIDRISSLETTGVVALSRRHPSDRFLNRLVQRIRSEIKYPLLPPVVTGLSSSYFYIQNDLNLMFVPMSEGNFLLHLPDLYHELAHPLLHDASPTLEDFQAAVQKAFLLAAKYLDDEIRRESRSNSPARFEFYLYLWQKSWWMWVIEFFCDLFAIFTVGPAFAWAHIHLCMKLGDDPYVVPTSSISTHPADDARMRVMLRGLEHLGYQNVDAIRRRWGEYLTIAGANSEPEYGRCFPDVLLHPIVDLAYDGMIAMKCRFAEPTLVDPIHLALNDAWDVFWNSPTTYIQWERDKIVDLNDLLQVPAQ